jgi:DNA-binding transcriptional MerR regulator
MRTGITAATLRAWERRYGLPSPNRSSQGYRLYSERDVALLYWLIQQTETGVGIGQAAQQLNALLEGGQDINVKVPPHHPQRGEAGPRSPEAIALDLAEAYSALDERRADDLMTEAAALYTLETTLIGIMRQALLFIREEVRQQQALSTVENVAFNHLRQRLLSILQTTTANKYKRLAIIVGFADERTELDLLILAALVRRNGFASIYLRAERDVPPLYREVAQTEVSVIVFYLETPMNANRLLSLTRPVDRFGREVRLLVTGTAVEIDPDLPQTLGMEYVGADLRIVARNVLDGLRQGQSLAVPVPVATRREAQTGDLDLLRMTQNDPE